MCTMLQQILSYLQQQLFGEKLNKDVAPKYINCSFTSFLVVQYRLNYSVLPICQQDIFVRK